MENLAALFPFVVKFLGYLIMEVYLFVSDFFELVGK